MFRSLRVRLPAVFLAGVVLAGAVSSAIAVTLFQGYTRDQVVGDLRQEADGLARLYSARAADVPLDARTLEQTTGDRIWLAPRGNLDLEFPEERQNIPGIKRIPLSVLPRGTLVSSGSVSFEFVPPGETRTYLAVSAPIAIESYVFGAIVVAAPKGLLREQWTTLAERLGLAFLVGVLVAGALGVYLSRRITRPVLALSDAADEIARGRYDVELPPLQGGDEVAHLSNRFGDMAERLREAEELERNFLMTVSHELRTPLTAIGGHVAALREGVVDDPELSALSLDVVAEETARLDRLVGDILDLAKLDARRFTLREEEVDMERLVERAYAGFTEEARRRAIDYRRDVRAAPVIETDGDRVLQIISNLLANAFRWTPDGGSVDVELAAANGTVSVAVQDTGPGIPKLERERIFRPFFSRDGRGTGLGLAIASELAEALGGRVGVVSEEGRGSRFELVLPAPRA